MYSTGVTTSLSSVFCDDLDWEDHPNKMCPHCQDLEVSIHGGDGDVHFRAKFNF